MTRLDEIGVALRRQGHHWRIEHRDDYDALLDLLAVAHLAVKARAERWPADDPDWDMMDQVLAPLLAEKGTGSAPARGEGGGL